VLLVTETLGRVVHGVYLHPDEAERRSGSWKTGPGEIFLLGDNRKHAVDSTSFGPVPRQNILGKVIVVRFSRDPQTGKWRRGRRRLPVK
jgi:signal peptidase I